jgi:Domain of unknown function (DUF4388)
MSLSSSFTDFSLAELFQLIDRGRKSGCLSVCTLPDLNTPESKSQHYYIWFRQGRIVAAAHRLQGQGLVSKITQRGWAKQGVLEKIYATAAPGTPLGLHLKTQEVLNAEQLNLLFASQLQQVRQLFTIQKGVFKLDCKATMPSKEMTGLSLKATEVALMALRALKNWDVLADALPHATCGIQSIPGRQSRIPLDVLESQVWEFADGSLEIKAIASQLNVSTAQVQQVAFRLMLAGFVEEVPVVKLFCELSADLKDLRLINGNDGESRKSPESEVLKVSTAFLQNLVGFLRSNA